MRFKDMASDEFIVTESEANKIMHIALPIGKNVLMANDVPEIMGEQTKMKTEVKFQSVQKVKKKQTNYLVGFLQVDKLRCLFLIVLGVAILECLETNMASSGWWILTQITKPFKS